MCIFQPMSKRERVCKGLALVFCSIVCVAVLFVVFVADLVTGGAFGLTEKVMGVKP